MVDTKLKKAYDKIKREVQNNCGPERIFMTTQQRGGYRPGAGRKKRMTPKATALYCGDLTKSERERIIAHVGPARRREILLAAAENRLHLLEDQPALDPTKTEQANPQG